MSGSGPTCAFLAADQPAALDLAAALTAEGVCRTARVASGPAPGPGWCTDTVASASNIVNLESVSKAYGTTTVFRDLSIGVSARDRIGVVGRNGDGKSTLLKLIIGTEQPDSGRVTRTGGVTVATVNQQVIEDDRATVRDLVVGDAATHEWAGDATVREVLAGLGLATLGLDSVFAGSPVVSGAGSR